MAASAVVVALCLLRAVANALSQMLGMWLGGTAYLQHLNLVRGDAFAIGGGAGPRLVFLSDPEAVRLFFTAPVTDIEFQPAAEYFMKRVFQLPNEDFYPMQQRMWRALRNMLTGSALRQRADELALRISVLLPAALPPGEKVGDLMDVVRGVLFEAVIRQLFGDAFVDAHGANRLGEAFHLFDSNFERAASPMPQLLQPIFRTARSMLLGAFRTSVSKNHFQGTLIQTMLSGCEIDDEAAPQCMLAVLWASMANSIPAAFWTLVLVLLPPHRHLAEQIRSEATRDAHSGATAPTENPAVLAALDPSSAARRCADEAIRIFSPSIDVRFAARDLTLPCTALGTAHHRRSSGGDSRGSNGSASEESYDSKPSLSRTSPTVPSNSPGVQVKKGDMLAVAPFLVHRDKRLFPSNPGKFNPTPSVPSHDSRPRTPSPGITEGHAEHNGRAANSGMGGSGNSLRCSSSLEAIPGISGAGISFGGGNYRCPGQGYAVAEVSLLVSLVVAHCHLELLPTAAAGAADQAPVRSPVKAPVKSPGLLERILWSPSVNRMQRQFYEELAPEALDHLPPFDHKRLVGIKWPAARTPALVSCA